MDSVRGIGTSPALAHQQLCFGNPATPGWDAFRCSGEVTFTCVGWRPVGARGGFALVMVGACDQHFCGIQDYLSEYGDCRAFKPDLALGEATRWRDQEDPSARLLSAIPG